MTVSDTPGPQRLQKLIAAAGLGSRRTVEQWIHEGRVSVNGRAAKLGDRALLSDEVCLDGRALELAGREPAPRRVIVYHKPIGEVTTRSDPQRRPTVFESLPPLAQGRWISVGRLDVMTSGLLLFTTDGELAHRLMHPSSEVQREYWVRILGRAQSQTLERLRSGITLEDGPARFDRIEREAEEEQSSAFRVVLHEGRNREVRRIWSAVGHEVIKLARLRYGPIELPRDLPAGRWRDLAPELMQKLIEESAAGQVRVS